MLTIRVLLIVALLMLTQFRLNAASVPIDAFANVDGWTSHPDGGLVEISHDTSHGKPAMHLHFANNGHGWGNACRAITLPPNACGIDMDVRLNSAGKGAQLFIWLFEKDGDGHLSYVKCDGKSLPEFAKGWAHCFVPISGFRYEARGNGKPEILTTDKMLIGLLGAESDICIANLAFRVVQGTVGVKEARTPNLQIKDGPSGKVAILCDSFPHQPSHSDPLVLSAELTKRGYGVTLLKSGDLADPGVLNWGNFDCLILPYGAYYPCSAGGIIKAFLKSGGSMVSMGGYALDTPCIGDASQKMVAVDSGETITAENLGGVPELSMNTRHGKPGDTLGLNPDQIGVFDPTYHLLNAVGLRAAQMQYIMPSTLKVKTTVAGYAACSMLGSNHPISPVKWGRHIPIANAYDRYGRSVGPVGSIAHNYAGPYAGSSWAFFGVTNTDLFAKNGPMLPSLGGIVGSVVRKTYLHSLKTDMACYKDGETVKISCTLADFGRQPFSGQVAFSIYDRNGKLVARPPAIRLFVKVGTSPELETMWRPAQFHSDLYRIAAVLSSEGHKLDSVETGFQAYDSKVRSSGLEFNYKDNYFRAGDRPVLLSGTNVTGAMFYSENENPLVWDRDLARMQENGMTIMRIMHLAPSLLDGKPGPLSPQDLPTDKLPLTFERRLDGLVQLAQKHHIVVLLALTEFQPVLSDADLDRSRQFCKLVAARYKDVPGFMVDIRNEPHVRSADLDAAKQKPPISDYWNDFLREKYKTDEALKAAWRVTPPEGPLGSIPCKPGTQAWDDMRTYDYDAFSDYLAQKWIAANAAGLKEGNPKLPVTVGFLQEYWALNKIRCMDNLDFADMHSYTGIDVLRADMKLFDRRFEGKSLSLGEFGSVEDHNKRVDGASSETQDWNRYLQTGHYVFGEGGSFMANWCWKDMDDVVFPWGVNYPNEGPGKDTLKAYRNQTLLFRQVRPAYKSPDTFLVVPTHMMLGGLANESIKMLYQVVDTMLGRHQQFGVIDDEHLDKIPASARTLIYPMPFGIPDKAYELLKSWVSTGGHLIVTGDISYDANRQRTNAARLEELCGVHFVSENYPNVGWGNKPGPCIKVAEIGGSKPEDKDMYVKLLGQGTVSYCPDPCGVMSDKGSAVGSGPPTHVMRIVGMDDSCTDVMVKPGDSSTGLVTHDKSGSVLSIEAQDSITLGKKTIPMKGHWALISCDGKDITQSREMIVLPFGGGEVDLGARGERRTSNIQRPTSNRPDTPQSEIRDPKSQDLVVQTGDVVDGKWKVLSESTSLKIKASGADAFDIRIVAPRSRLQSVAQLVVSELMLSDK